MAFIPTGLRRSLKRIRTRWRKLTNFLSNSRVREIKHAARGVRVFHTRNDAAYRAFVRRSQPPGKQNISPWRNERIAVRHWVDKQGKDRFVGMIAGPRSWVLKSNTEKFRRHDAAHVIQAVFHFRHGFRLTPFSELAQIEDYWIRGLGFRIFKRREVPDLFDIPLAQRELTDFVRIRKMVRDDVLANVLPRRVLAVDLPKHFRNEKSFLRALVALHRAPRMEQTLRVLNTRFVPREYVTKAYSDMIDFFEEYLERHPQSKSAASKAA